MKLPMTNQSWMDLNVSLSLLLPEVCEEKKIIGNGKELYDFPCGRMVVNSTYDSVKPMLNRKSHLRRCCNSKSLMIQKPHTKRFYNFSSLKSKSKV